MYLNTKIDKDKYPMLYQYTHSVKKPERDIVGRDEEIDRIMAAMMRPELCNVILLAEAGSGKAHMNGTMVAVSDIRGYVPIEDLKVGDYVFNDAGEKTKVLGVFPQGKKRAYKVYFEDGRTNICNDEHIWRVMKSRDTDEYEDLTLRQIINDGGTYYIPDNKAIEREYNKPLMDSYSFGVAYDDTYILDECIYEKIENRVSDVESIFEYITDEIPESYYLLSVEERLNVVRGIMDSKAYISNDEHLDVIFTTENETVSICISRLLHSLGLKHSVHKINVDLDTMVYRFKLNLTYEEKLNIFTRNDYISLIKSYKDNYVDTYMKCVKIDHIEDLEMDVPMTCIYVEGNHLYQVGYEHLVTHNTALVQGTMMKDDYRYYLEVNMSKMIADISNPNQMADRLKELFNEVERCCNDNSKEIVLFIDEFHQVVQLSSAAVEALKPLLADSGTRGIRVIAATTFD